MICYVVGWVYVEGSREERIQVIRRDLPPSATISGLYNQLLEEGIVLLPGSQGFFSSPGEAEKLARQARAWMRRAAANDRLFP